MPIKGCTTKQGKSGWKWGSSGKCYKSKSGAKKQRKAAYANGYKKRKK